MGRWSLVALSRFAGVFLFSHPPALSLQGAVFCQQQLMFLSAVELMPASQEPGLSIHTGNGRRAERVC